MGSAKQPDEALNIPDEGALRVALEHAQGRWEAETENAARLAHRENGILTLVAAVLGLGLFKLGEVSGIEPTWLSWLVRILLLMSMLAMAVGLATVLIVIRSRENQDGKLVVAKPDVAPNSSGDARQVFASGHLGWPPQTEVHPTELESAAEALAISYKLTTKAANSLLNRNLGRKSKIDRGQLWLLLAGLLAGVALGCYILFGARADAATRQGGGESTSAETKK
ncbi:MAG: hypothetical protein JNN27_07540 [Planctomycetes bacterium]|nr:hypothetical protein [Planctomycetota bacterium]